MEVPKGSGISVDAPKHQKSGRPINAKDKNPWKTKSNIEPCHSLNLLKKIIVKTTILIYLHVLRVIIILGLRNGYIKIF